MTELLRQVVLPSSAVKIVHNRDEEIFARIQLLMKLLEFEKTQLLPNISEDTRKEIQDWLLLVEPSEYLQATAIEPEVPEYLTVREVSQLTGLVPQVVRRHLVSGKFKGEQVAGENSTWRIFPQQFTGYSNWTSFLKKRKEEIKKDKHDSIQLVKLGLELSQSNNEVPKDRGSE